MIINLRTKEKSKSSRKKGGFTLIETMIAVAIVAMAILGPLNIISTGLKTAYLSRDQLTATALAQDAIEYVRSVRDQSRLRAAAGDLAEYLNDCIPDHLSALGCIVDTNSIINPGSTNDSHVDMVTDTHNNNLPLNYNESTGLYGYSSGAGWVATKFYRIVEISPSSNSPGYLASSTVSWQSVYGPQVITLIEYLYNW
jgi:prepilin-type N-terminal cleavage/methylation domain-containing protein